MEGILHAYHTNPTLNLFEYTPRSTQSSPTTTTPPNVLLFIGGLYDNFSSPEYLVDLAELFPRYESQQWALMHVQLSSAMRGFGTSDLNQDIKEITLAITHIRQTIRKGEPTSIVLLGQSTGCQDTLHYLSAPNPKDAPRPEIQGAILQAPVSDRDALIAFKFELGPERKEYFNKCMSLIATLPKNEHKSYLLPLHWTRPLFGSAPLCVSRFLDLASPSSPDQPRTDDFFSHDLPESKLNSTFGRVGSNSVLSIQNGADPSIMMLVSESDVFVSKPLDADGLLSMWGKALSSSPTHPVKLHPQSKLIKDGTHDLSGDIVGQQRARLVVLREAVLKYIDEVVGSVDEFAWSAWKKGVEKVQGLEKGEQ